MQSTILKILPKLKNSSGPSLDYAVEHNLIPFISMQNMHTLLYTEEEREIFLTLKHIGVGCIPWSLTGPLGLQTKRNESDELISVMSQADCKEVIHRVEELANKKA
jgi:aryl-alcohol dehydrogenase-like predicted oxidoreductase